MRLLASLVVSLWVIASGRLGTTAVVPSTLSPLQPTSAGSTITLTGQLTVADYERIIERTFDVPVGTRRIDLTLTASGAEQRTVIDLGLRDPDGPRGWSGGRTSHVTVSRLSATPGYLPGSIPPGQWSVLLGVPNIRADRHDSYTVTVTLSGDDSGGERPVLRDGPGWFVGDLHTHSQHSDGRGRAQSGTGVPAPVHRVLDQAIARGLDFVALSDHNTASHWLDVDRLQPYYDHLLLLHSREITTYRGHANTVGERTFADFRLPSPAASPAEMLRPIAATGAFVSINHPTAPDDERCMGCGWNVLDDATRSVVHGVEVVNGDTRNGPLYGWPLWASLLNRGWRLTAVGGSDDHTPDDDADRMIGTPATVVWAEALSEEAIVAGLKSGRVYLRTRGAAGPSIDMDARAAQEVYPMGAEFSAPATDPLLLRARVDGAAGATLDWVLNGQVVASEPIGALAAVLEHQLTMAPGDWTSIVVRDGAGPIAISNAIRRR